MDKYKHIRKKELYKLLLKTGILWVLYPELTGEWKKDKKIIKGKKK